MSWRVDRLLLEIELICKHIVTIETRQKSSKPQIIIAKYNSRNTTWSVKIITEI